MAIFVYVEHHDGVIKRVSLELLGKARELADQKGEQVAAIVLGYGVEKLATTVGEYGADIVFLGDDERLAEYNGATYARTLVELIKKENPSMFLAGATAIGKDMVPRVAARLGVSMVSDITGLSLVDGKTQITRPVYAGKILADFGNFKSSPEVITVRSRAFPLPVKSEGRQAEIRKLTSEIQDKDLKTVIKEVIKSVQGMVDLTEADIIVSGGFGMKNAENFALLEELAGLLGAAVGASRAAVDAGYAPYARQVGQTGKVVSPTVYIACGISGAMQHLAGMGSSKYIVAINKDPDAPIFKVADFGIVGDLFKVVPAFIAELKAAGK